MSWRSRAQEMGRRVMGRPLLQVLWTFRAELLAAAAFSCVINLLMLTPTLYMLQLYDRVMISRSEFTLIASSAMALLFLGVMAFSEWLRSQLLVRVGVRFDESIHTRLFHALFERALASPSENPAGGLQHLLQLRQFLTGTGVLGFLDLPWTPVFILISWLLHPALGLLSLAFVAVMAGLAWWGYRQQAPLAKPLQAGARSISGFVQSKLRHADAVESMGMLRGLRGTWLGMHRDHQAASARLQRLAGRHQAISRFVQYAQQSLVLAAGAWLVIRGELSMGAMIAANVLMARALQPVQAVAAGWGSYFAARDAFSQVDELLAGHAGRSGISLSQALRGELTLAGVSATAPGRTGPILSGINLRFSPGELSVILGPSGSGKSTLGRCLLGIWPGARGRVQLDGEPIGAWDRQELGPHLGYLPQDVQLLAGTVAENIARLGPVDPERVVRAAQAAGVHELILRLPEGYDTPLDAGASQLSAGHRQRLGLARALYGEPALLVLDEPNSNLDDAGEAALLRALEALRGAGKTVIVITHRGRLIEAADRLVMLERGQVSMYGTREEVLRQISALRRKPNLAGQPTAAEEAT